jgi:hypothetical protein
MNRYFTGVLFITMMSLPLAASAQEIADLITDRPDQTESPVLVPRHALQVETGVVLERDRVPYNERSDLFYNSTLLRYGINSNLELRFVSEYLSQSITTEQNTIRYEGFGPIALGMKLKLADEKSFWPQAGVICHVQLKTGSAEWTPSYTAVDLRFAFANTLSEKWSLSYNLGLQSGDDDRDIVCYYTAALGYLLHKNLAAFVEQYSFFPEGTRADYRFDGGLTWKVKPLVQLDLSGGIGLTNNAPDYFVGTGVSFRCFR